MKNFSKKTKIIISVAAIGAVIASAPFVLYLKVIPYAVSSPKVLSHVQNILDKQAGLKLNVKSPVLNTALSPELEFKVEELSLYNKENQALLAVQNFDTKISFAKVFKKIIIVKKLGADDIYADINKLMALAPKQNQETQKPSDWYFDFFDSLLYVKKSTILYDAGSNTLLTLNADNLRVDNTQKVIRYVHFDIKADIEKAKKHLSIAIADKNTVFIKDKKIFVQDCVLNINKSKVYFNADADKKNNFNVEIYSNKFGIKDVIELVESNIIENNISEVLAYFKDINGSFDFNVKLNNNSLNGLLTLNKADLKIVPVNNLPVTLQKGSVVMTKNDVILKDFEGFYNNKKENRLSFKATVNDYLKSIDTDLEAHAVVTNDFAKNYFSNLVGAPVTLTGGNTKTKLTLKSINNKIDLVWLFGLKPGQDILLDGNSFSPVNYRRMLKADLHFEDMLLGIKSINYYIAPNEVPKLKKKPQPIMQLSGNIDFSKGDPIVKDFGFDIPKPLPSEFLNLFTGEKLFRKGTFSGNLKVDNNGKYPVIDGNMSIDGMRIPSQRLGIKSGKLVTENGLVRLSANGKCRRTNYDFNGDIVNAIKFPIIIKDVNLTVDNVDVERFLTLSNSAPAKEPQQEIVPISYTVSDEEPDDNVQTFDMGNVIVEKCNLNILKGFYKGINFADVHATMSLDKDSILKMYSNRFEIAEGHSSGKVDCDLKNQKYNIILGIKDVNSDIMATSLLNLPREISGKASGLMELSTDKSMKLNGSIKFIVQNGTIGKIGLVEYVMKFAALFRNPLAMISPSTFSDLVNIPEGNFDKITGELLIKDNVVNRMQIKSYAPQLSAFIAGRYDLENKDASLRIYTKFSSRNKGFAGFLRNISLNSLANRVPLSSRNDANYYSAELEMLPPIDADEKDCQVFLTTVDGDVENNNFLSSLKKIK